MKSRWFALALVALTAPAALRADVLDVPLTPQEQLNWCWAASTKAVLGYYMKPVEERQLADYACLRADWSPTACDCWTEPGNTSSCNRYNYLYDHPGSINDLLSAWGLSNWAGQWTLSFAALQTEIDTNRRPLIALRVTTSAGHFVVIRGATQQGGTDYVHYMNPWPVNQGSYATCTYSAFVNDGTWTWTHTLKVTRSFPPTIYGVGSGSTFANIQSAVDAATNMDQVWIMNGNYSGSGNENISFGGKSITVRSYTGRPQDVVITPSGDPAFSFGSESPGAILEAVTIHGGAVGADGGAIRCSQASPTIRNCRFEENRALANGGAIYADHSLLTVLECSFVQNDADRHGGAVAVGTHSSPALIGCTFNENYAQGDGGGVWCDNTITLQGSIRTPILMDCSFDANIAQYRGGGLRCRKNLTPHVQGCTFSANRATDGAGIAFNSEVDGRIGSCTVSEGFAFGSGGGIFLGDSTQPTIDHTIVSFSTSGDGLHCATGSVPALTCVDIFGNAGGNWQGQPFAGQLGQNGNIEADPMYCGSSNPQTPYSLGILSPCAGRNNPGCGQIGALGIGCGVVPVPGLANGVLIVHCPPGVVYSSGQNWCGNYDAEFSIHQCGEQVNQINDRRAAVWYVLCAWEVEKQWCGAQFGLGGFNPMAFDFVEWGRCGPTGTMETPTPGWPGPNQGIVLEAPPGVTWSGNFTPVYWFAGYAYEPAVMPLTPHPQTGFGGWTDCATPPVQWPATCFGAMGVLTAGNACCPGGPPPVRACCGASGACTLTTEIECTALGGMWHDDWHTCDPNPCPPPVAVCCVEEQCSVVSEAECLDFGGTWHATWTSCQPNPCVPRRDWADHAIGDCMLTVTDQGSLGFMDGSQQQGSGFVYPIGGANQLFIGSLWVGESPTYIANRDYDADPAREWRVSVDPDGHIWLDDGGISHLDIHAAYTDSAAAQPRNLLVEQESWSYSGNDAADDFVILRYHVQNRGPATLANAYVGLFMDVDLGSIIDNEGQVDAARRLLYLTESDTSQLHVGLRMLEESPGNPPVSNLTFIRNRDYVWPSGYVADSNKYGFLSAGAPEYVVPATPAPDDYDMLAAAGPFSLAPGGEVLCAFAVIGGSDFDRMIQHADVAALIYRNGFQGAPWDLMLAPITTRLLPSAPNPFRDRAWIGFDLARAGRIELALYDASGRRLRTLLAGWRPAMRHALTWDGRDNGGRVLPSGAYFLRLIAPGREETQRLVRIR
jgi:predicted outer membrane repeat protein